MSGPSAEGPHDGFVALVDSLDEASLQPIGDRHLTRWRFDYFADVIILVILRPAVLAGPVEQAAGWGLFDKDGHAIWTESFLRPLTPGDTVHVDEGGRPTFPGATQTEQERNSTPDYPA